MYRAGGAVSAKAPGRGAFAHDERGSSGAIGSRLSLFWGSSRNVPVLGVFLPPVDLFLTRSHRAFLAPYPKTSAGEVVRRDEDPA